MYIGLYIDNVALVSDPTPDHASQAKLLGKFERLSVGSKAGVEIYP